jgi:hypothetical protein
MMRKHTDRRRGRLSGRSLVVPLMGDLMPLDFRFSTP